MLKEKNRPIRTSIRLPEYDYAQNGAYFITICSNKRQCVFCSIYEGRVVLNNLGKIAYDAIWEIPSHRDNVEICNAVVMPNHVHILLLLHNEQTPCENVGKREFSKPIEGSLSMIVGAYKAAVTRTARKRAAGMTSHAPTLRAEIWQRGFYDHVIRNDADYRRIWRYIDENPLKWREDTYWNPMEEERM